jgi:hypothetical protein
MRYTTAVLAAIGMSVVLGYLHLISYGHRHRYDAVLAVQLTGNLQELQESLRQILHHYCDHPLLASQQQLAADTLHISYRVLLRDPGRYNELRDALQEAKGIEEVNLYLCQDEAEI